MVSLRTTKTASGATAVQVVRYENRRTIVLRHVGSTHDPEELMRLKQAAIRWITTTTRQSSLFPLPPVGQSLPLAKYEYRGFRYGLAQETLANLATIFKFHLLGNSLLIDLVIARILEPGSKLQSLAFLKHSLGITHPRCELYRQIPLLSALQDVIEAKVLAIAKKEFSFSFALVFYDVTTLYFESFQEDDLRVPGFSKDQKAQQPQILLGLLVTGEGFPVAYQIFKGNTFEGHTIIPVISAFKRKHKVGRLTVVADAAMISLENITALRESNLQYIVAARTANLSPKLIAVISSTLERRDGATVRLPTEHYGDLICSFSAKRFAKDEREMNKQILKANELLKNPSVIKRAKFIKTVSSSAYAFNTELVEKTRQLLGIKGYYTNLGPDVADALIIEQYHNLWHVEHAFRIAKSDLEMRPMYHYKEHTIRTHVLICFMALAICKYMELKTGHSTRNILHRLKAVSDARMFNTVTKEEVQMRSPINDETKQVLIKLGLSY